MNEFNMSFEKIRFLLSNLETAIRVEVLPLLKLEIEEYIKEVDKYNEILKKNYIISNDSGKNSFEVIGIDILDEDIVSGMNTNLERQLYQRINAIQGLLKDFIEKYTVDIKYFDIKKLKDVEKVIDFIDWSTIFYNPTNSFTKNLGQSIKNKIVKSKILSANIFDSLHKILNERIQKIKNCLSILIFYKKELFKLKVRENLFPNVIIPEIPNEQFVDKYIPKLYKDFSKYLKGETLYIGSLKEAILEDYYHSFRQKKITNFETLVKFTEGKLLQSNSISKEKKVDDNKKFASTLHIQIEELMQIKSLIARITDKINFNWQLYFIENKTGIGSLLNIFEKQRETIDPFTLVIDLEYYDKKRNSYKMVPLNLDGIINLFIRTTNEIVNLTKKRKTVKDTESASQFQEELDILLESLNSICSITDALQKYLKANLPKENIDHIKSTDNEIKEIERNIVFLKGKRLI